MFPQLRSARPSILVGLLVLAGLALAQEERPSADTAPILNAYRALESGRDAKCYSTACRFENFLYGTPLSDEARETRIELQKEFVRRVWEQATSAADATGEESIGAARIAPVIEALVRIEETSEAVRVRFGAAQPIELAPVRVRQYGTISYSIRAILSVQQDHLFQGGSRLGTLAPDGIAALERALNVVLLCALESADRAARDASEPEVSADGLRQAWRALLPESPTAALGQEVTPNDATRAAALGLLRDIAAEKTAAYGEYNGISPEQVYKLLAANTERFYARYPLPREPEPARRLLATFHQRMERFALELLREAETRARAAGHDLVRSQDARDALQSLYPHVVDSLEDVHVFPRLPSASRYVLEAFDCDSFRDYGIHWNYFLAALEAPEPPAILPDPFAAEILAEGVSGYAVLLFRAAGDVARTELSAPELRPADLERGARRIRRRAAKNAELPPLVEVTTPIASAPTRAAAVEQDGAGHFTEVAAASGLAFTHRSAQWLDEFRRKELKRSPTFSGGGVAAEDVDDDGHPDLLFVGGRAVALYLGDGKGGFTDVTEACGLSWSRADGTGAEARQPIVADFDNDGRQDVLITYANDAHRLYRNTTEPGAALRFEDVTTKAGLGGANDVGGAATAFDYDRDGLLDLYICSFGDYLAGEVPVLDRESRNGLPNHLLHNKGGLVFEDVTEASGTGDRGWAQAVSHCDFDRDGWQDLIVANDFGRNAWFKNLGDGRFREVAGQLDISNAFHSMSVGICDLNADGFPEVYVSNIAMLVKDNKYVLPDVTTPVNLDPEAMANALVKESDVLYVSRAVEGKLASYSPGRDIERGPTSTGWAWDAEFFDLDLDGDDDLYVVNGLNDFFFFDVLHSEEAQDGKDRHALLSHARESNVLFRNEGGKLRNVSPGSGADLLQNARSTAYLDFDGDGDLDVAINSFHDKASFLRNELAPGSGNWLEVELVGDPARGSTRDAIGARLELDGPDGLRVVREIQGGSGFLSMNPKEQHFGLGAAALVRLTIVWPGGARQIHEDLAANRRYSIRQGAQAPDPVR